MSLKGKSLLDTQALSNTQIDDLFLLADRIRTEGWNIVRTSTPKLISLVFLEPSTRTTSSFEAAALRSGHQVMSLNGSFSSTTKGETLLDTLLTLSAMKPDVLIVRHGTNESLKNIDRQLNVPVINAGEGVSGHPTQALLDAYTIRQSCGAISDQRILFVGDVKHSRVATSGCELFESLGAQTAVCGPDEWSTGLKKISSLEEGLRWATVCMTLRIQRERQPDSAKTSRAEADFISKYQLNKESMKWLTKNAIIMHPGPFNRGVEITEDVLSDSRCRIWQQVENGVYVRGALLAQILGAVG